MYIADFHIHSKYSRATSKNCVPELLDHWARRKGLDLIGTGDFTHAAWRAELAEKLVPCQEGVYALRQEYVQEPRVAGHTVPPRFLVTGEISTIYKKNGRVRKVHSLILLPHLEAAAALARRLERIGNLHSDGRPILGLDCRDLLELTLDTAPDALFIPAHIWTPHFSLFGAYSGFDAMEECFGDLTPHIHALETGLSSDPAMNWRLSALDNYALVSNSDAHSPGKLGREANLFACEPTYPNLVRALTRPGSQDFCGTLEFFPEEGKYHWDGHRNCGVSMAPEQTNAAGGVCPACGRNITVGVLHRVEALADRPQGYRPAHARRFERLAPLDHVLASCLGMGAGCARVTKLYDKLLGDVGNELYVLRQAPLQDIAACAGPIAAEGIRRLRLGDIHIQSGFDGQYGKIQVLLKEELGDIMGQLTFLDWAQVPPSAPPDKPQAAAVAPAAPAPPEAGAGQAAPMPGGLNREQLQAVESQAPAVAVIAGPGTGKTHTLVSRILHLVERGVSPHNITAVTFTNKAARELRERLERRLSPGAAGAMTVGTFHGICLRRLAAAGAAVPSVTGEPESLSLLEGVAQELGWDGTPQELARRVSLAKNGALEGAELPAGVLERYGQLLARYGAADYDDILLRGLSLARGQAATALPGGHLLVDEFQDISPVQYELIRAWAQQCAGVFVIGDPCQAIYGFRGSSPRCFERFLEDFAPVERVELAVNYRSTPQILRVAAAALPGSPALAARRAQGPVPRCIPTRDAYAQAIAVAQRINRMVGGVDMREAHAPSAREQAARGFEDIAVLYRTNRQAQALEECLTIEGIPYAVTGRDAWTEDRQVRRAAAFFRFLLHQEDALSLRLCLQEADAGCAEKLLHAYLDGPRTLPALAQIIQGSGSPGLSQFWEMAHKYLPLLDTKPPAALLAGWAKDNALHAHPPLELLVGAALTRRDLPGLLQDLGSVRDAELTRAGGKHYNPRCVSLMTLHAAKGLEFPVVFLYGVSEGLLPYQGRGGVADLAEERRLFYVGVTRAQEELVLLYSGEQSRFLAQLPQRCLEREAVPPRRREGVQTTLF